MKRQHKRQLYLDINVRDPLIKAGYVYFLAHATSALANQDVLWYNRVEMVVYLHHPQRVFRD